MYEFNYRKVDSVAAAVEAMQQAEDGKFVAGGQTMLPTMKHRLASPFDLIDLGGVAELTGISVENENLIVGAMTTHAAVAASAEVQQAIPALARLAGNIGDPAVRNRGTLGGSIANHDPAADYPAAVIALGATVQTSKRGIPAWLGYRLSFMYCVMSLQPSSIPSLNAFFFPDTKSCASCSMLIALPQ